MRPTGSEAIIYGRNTYVAEIENGSSIIGIFVIVPDAFVWQFVNNRILADHYASRGDYRVYLPNFMDGLYMCICHTIKVESTDSL